SYTTLFRSSTVGMGMRPVVSRKSADAAPAPWRFGRKSPPWPWLPWHHAQSRRYRRRPGSTCTEAGGEPPFGSGDGRRGGCGVGVAPLDVGQRNTVDAMARI